MASWMNEEQEDYVKSLAKLGAEKLCWCGWYPKGECYNNCPKDLSAADKLARKCIECGNHPFDHNNSKIYHKLNCSKYEK